MLASIEILKRNKLYNKKDWLKNQEKTEKDGVEYKSELIYAI